MGNINDEALLLEFVTESREHLSSIEPDLLVLEREGSGAGSEIINRVFRAIHSIKGASGFFGLEALKSLSHVMESVLMMVRDGKLDPNPQVMDPLLVGVDRLREMLDDIQASEDVQYKDVTEQLEAIMVNGGAAPQATVALQTQAKPGDGPHPISFFQPDQISVESAIQHGQRLMAVRVFPDADLLSKGRNLLDITELLLSTGNVLDTAVDIDCINDLSTALDAPMPLMFLYATVLEADLVALSLSIPESQIRELELVDALSKKHPFAHLEAAQPAQAETPAPAAAAEEPAPGEKSEPVHPIVKTEGPRKPAASGETESVRVKVDLLNKLMDLAGEMVLARNQLIRSIDTHATQANGLSNIIQNVDLVTSDLQEHIMQTRMQPIASIFGKFPRVVRDLSRQLGKEIELQMIGEEVELDKSILESLSDPLTHLIRNCCDHALETPEEREKSGKSRCGLIQLQAYQEGGHINIAITDDGRGIDHERIARKAIANGAISEAEVRRMSPQEQVNLIFLPGLSTAEKVTDVSGRGVGMDVVRTNIEEIGGSISVETEMGVGTTILLSLPLTLAIIPSLVVKASQQTFAIPQINLVELVSVKASEIASRIEKVGTAPVLRLRGKLLPLVKLTDVLGMDKTYLNRETGEFDPDRRDNIVDRRQQMQLPGEMVQETGDDLVLLNRRMPSQDRRTSSQSDYNILVLKAGNNQYGLIVEEIKDMEEIVVKPLSSYLKNCKCYSGATIMGDGRVAMILDCSGIVNISGLSFSEINAESDRRSTESITAAGRNAGERQSIILFSNAEDEVFAIPLNAVTRLDKFSMKDIENVGSRKFLTYGGKGLPLLRLEEHIPVGPAPNDMEEAYLIIPKTGEEGMAGIVASRILDTVDTCVELEPSHIEHPSVKGLAVINQHLTLFIEPQGLLEAAGISSAKGV